MSRMTAASITITYIAVFIVIGIAPADAGTWRDSFDNGNFDGWKRPLDLTYAAFGWEMDTTAEWTVENGELVTTSKEVCNLGSLLTVGDDTWDDYELSVRVKIDEIYPPEGPCTIPGSEIWALVFFSGDDGLLSVFNGFYGRWPRVGVPETWGCETLISSHEEMLQFVPGSYPQMGEWFTMQVIARRDGTRRFLANGTEICAVRQDAPLRGGIALSARNMRVRFDDVTVTGPNVPDFDQSTAVSSQGNLPIVWARLKTR